MALARSSRSWTRLDGIDLLRGLAILLVLMNHVNMRLLGAHVPYTKGLPPQLVSSLVWNGQYGVQIFFAVSGFIITSTTLQRWGSLAQVNVREFYQLRFARIAPLLLLLVAVLSGLHLAGVESFVVSSKTGGLGRALFAALTFHINLLEARRGYLPPAWDILWSLSVEEIFYLGFPLACRLFSRSRFLLVPLLVLVVLGPFARACAFNPNPVWREYSYLGGMDAIAFGCLTALIVARVRLIRRTVGVLAAVGLAMLVFILGFSIRAHILGLGRNGLDMTLLAVGTCLVITAAAQTGWRAPSFLSPLRLIGRRSYEVYLTHIFVVMALFRVFARAGKPLGMVPALFLTVLLLAALIGTVTALGYTEPVNRWLRRRWGDNAKRLGSLVETNRS